MTLDEVYTMLSAKLEGITSWDDMDDSLRAEVIVYHQLCLEAGA